MEVKSKFNLAAVIYGSILMLSVLLIVISMPLSVSASIDLEEKIFSSTLNHAATALTISGNQPTKTIITRAETLNQAFTENDISVPSGTITNPHRQTSLNGGFVTVAITSASIPVTIVDGSRSHQIRTSSNSVKNILTACNIKLSQADTIYPALDRKVSAGSIIVIDRATPVLISYGQETYALETQAKTAAEALSEAQEKYDIPADEISDEILAGTNKSIYSGLELTVSRQRVEEYTENEVLNFDTIYNDDWNMMKGEQVVTKNGANGEIRRTYLITFEDDIEISREIISEQIISDPVTREVTIGQKQPEVINYPEATGDVGTASWYHYGSTPTCAHRNYPKGSQLLVTNNSTGAQIIVTVNDYGPAAWTGRVIDLNSVAFSAIAPLGQGLVNVTVTPL